MADSEKEKFKKKARALRRAEYLESRNMSNQDIAYINSLKQRIADLEEAAIQREEIIKSYKDKEKRIKIYNVTANIDGKDVVIYAALLNKKIYSHTNYEKLVFKLRGLGYLIKETNSSSCKSMPFDGYYTNIKDTISGNLPDFIPEDL